MENHHFQWVNYGKSPFWMGKLTFSCSNKMVIHFSPMLSRPFKSLASSGAPGQAGGEQQGFLHNLSTLHDPGLTTWDGRPMVVAKKTGTLLYISTDDIIYIYTLYLYCIYLSIYLYLYISIYIYIWNLWLPSYLWPVWEMETSHFIHVAAIRCCSSAKPFWVKQLIFLMWWNAAVCCLLETSLGMPHYM